jgi:hypothetical protein
MRSMMIGHPIYSTVSDFFITFRTFFLLTLLKSSNSSKSEQASLRSIYDRRYVGIEIDSE